MYPLLFLTLVVLPAAAQIRGVIDTGRSPHVQQQSLDLTAVHWTGGFWGRWYELNRTAVLPTVWGALAELDNGAQYNSFLKVLGKDVPVGMKELRTWSDGDVYKYVEALAAHYAQSKDPALAARMDEMIAVFAQAQEPDGYISTPLRLRGIKRWVVPNNHELYNLGHMMTAAVTHHRATGKTTFLNIATKTADYLYTVFQPRPKELAHFAYNPSNIMGLAELYRDTGNPKYLELAGIFVDMRGSQPGGTDQNQTRVRLREETEAVGHGVLANYLWAGAADVYAETGERALLGALDRIWTDAATRKIYITGAVGNLHNGISRRGDRVHEAYGHEFEFPNRLAYNETCANIASAMFSWRMLGATGEARFGDLMETTLYNSVVSGVAVDGKSFFYANPLRRDADELRLIVRPVDGRLRRPWLTCYCCPTNVTRTLAELQGWVYGKSNDALWVNLYGANKVTAEISGGTLALEQATDYPWDGLVRLKLTQAPPREFAMKLRIPAWAEGAELKVNQAAAPKPRAGAYAELRRKWAAGDVVELRLPMEPRLVEANPYVETSRGQVAVMRGPLVYALESPDLPAGVNIWDVAVPANAQLRAKHEPGLLGGITVVEARARLAPSAPWGGALYRALQPSAAQWTDIRLIPYYAWANRGLSRMTVWLPITR